MSRNYKEAPREIETTYILEHAVQEHNSKLHTPESVTKYWQTLWQVWEARAGLVIPVPNFPDTKEGLAEHERKGDKVIYVPEDLSTQEDRYLLAKIWPEMGSYSTEKGNTVKNQISRSGYLYIETSVDAPNLNINEEELKELFESQGREGMNLTEYIIGSQDSKLISGRYFDEGSTVSSLLGSRRLARVVYANFVPDGRLEAVSSIGRRNRNLNLGGRSVEVIKA